MGLGVRCGGQERRGDHAGSRVSQQDPGKDKTTQSRALVDTGKYQVSWEDRGWVVGAISDSHLEQCRGLGPWRSATGLTYL